MAELMTQAEYGKHRKVSQPTVSTYIKKGKIPKSCIETVEIDGRFYKQINAEKADKALDQNLDVRKQRDVRVGPGGKGPAPRQVPEKLPQEIKSGMAANAGMKMHDAQRLGEIYKTLLLEQKYKVEKGLLCPVADFENDMKTCAREVRNSIQVVPAQLKMELAKETNPDKVALILRKALDGALIGAIPKQYYERLEIVEEIEDDKTKN